MKVRGIVLVLLVGMLLSLSWQGASVALAAGETFQVVSVNTTGCNSGNFGMTVQRANLDGGTYTVRTVVTVGGLIYMNEAATISVNGLSGWNIFNNFTYGAVPNPGTYPIPSGQQMQLDFTLERPVGTILYSWQLVVDGCNTGNILFNGVPVAPEPEPEPTLVPVPGPDLVAIPSGAVGGMFLVDTPIYWAPQADAVTSTVMQASKTVWVYGMDASGAYYKVMLAGKLFWVPVGTMGPNPDAVWQNRPLPTQVVD